VERHALNVLTHTDPVALDSQETQRSQSTEISFMIIRNILK